MTYLAYNLFLYRYDKDYEVKLNIFKKYFPNEEYLLPYSQLTKKEISDTLKCEEKDLAGLFIKDLDFIMQKCKKIAIFPTKDNYIGLGTYWEIVSATKYNLEKIIYNKQKNLFSKEFKIKDAPLGIRNATFYKKIIF